MNFHPVYGGGALRFKRYLPGLSARGVRLEVFTATPDRARAALSEVDGEWLRRPVGDLLPREVVDGVPVYRLTVGDGSTMRRQVRYGRGLTRFCRDEHHRPDVVQVVSSPLWYSPWLLSLRRAGIRTVLAWTIASELSSNAVRRLVQRQIRRMPFRCVDRVIVSSQAMRDDLTALGVTTAADVIPNGVDIDRFRPTGTPAEREDARRLLRISGQGPVVMYVGAVSPRKGTDLLLEAWPWVVATVPDARLVVVGPRYDGAESSGAPFQRRVDALARQAGGADCVTFLGRVESIETYLRAADLFVLPSRREGMPNAMLEAMATGLPVVATPFVGRSDELGRPDEHYLLSTREPRELAEAIVGLLEDPDRRRTLGDAARDWVASTMPIETSVERYAEIYRELAWRSR